MKLYATITSERASKGQGGKWIELDIKDEQQETILTLLLVPDDEDGTVYHAKLKTADSVFLEDIGDIEKGNKQKGELDEGIPDYLRPLYRK